MPRFGNFWNANSIHFFYKSHAAWLRGENASLEDDIELLARQNALPSDSVNGSIDNHETIVNPYLMIAILFGDMDTFSLLRQNLRLQRNSDFSMLEKIVICQFAFNFHGNELFYLQLSRALNWNETNPRSNGCNQHTQICRYKEETKKLTGIYIESNFTRLRYLLDSFTQNHDSENESEIIRTIIEFYDQSEIISSHGNVVLLKAVTLQNLNIVSTLIRVPNLNLESITTLRIPVVVRDVLSQFFPAALEFYNNRHTVPPLTATDVTPDTATFSTLKIQSLLAQFSTLQNVAEPLNGEHIIEQIRFIERYESHPELIMELLPQINQLRSSIVLSVALQTAGLNEHTRAGYQSTYRNTWKRGANLYNVNPFAFERQMEPLTASEKNTAAFVLDFYLDSTQPDKLLKINGFLCGLFIVCEHPNSDLFHQPHVLERLVAYTDQVNNELLNTLVDSIPAVRNWRVSQRASQAASNLTLLTMLRSLSTNQRAQLLNTNEPSILETAIASQSPAMLQAIVAAFSAATTQPHNVVAAVNNSTAAFTSIAQQSLGSSSSSSSSSQPAPVVQTPPPEPTAEELSKSLRELIHAAENEPILKFLQTNKAPEIYNNFPMPRHTIFVLLHYLMHHKNLAILSALLDVKGLEHQGIGPYNETIHQFFARYFGPASKTPWAEAITLVTEKIQAITVNSETQIEYKPRTLLQATMLGDVDLVRKCLDALRLIPLAINFADLQTKETALMIAVKNRDIAIIKELVASKNCQVNLKDCDGNTAFMLAAAQGSRDIIELLREKHKVDITIKNNQNKNAAILANDNGYSELAGDLLQLIQDAEIENKKAEAEDKRRKDYVESLDGYTKRMQDIGRLDQFREEFLDPVTGKIMTDPIPLDDGYTLDRATIKMQLEKKQNFNPINKIPFPANILTREPNRILKALIEAKVIKYEKAHAAHQNQNQDDDNDVDDKVTMPKLG